MKLEPSVKMFYTALEEGRILAKRCGNCGYVEFPPKPACNKCGTHDMSWCEISGRAEVKTVIMPSMMSARPYLKELSGKDGYAYGEVQIEEGSSVNAVILGVNKKNVADIEAKLAAGERVGCTAQIVERPEGYKTVFFRLDD